MKLLTKLFKYIENLWIGKDKKPSLRASLAIAFSVDFISNTSYAIHKWELGKSYADVAMMLGVEAALIAALLGLRMYQDIQQGKQNPQSALPENQTD